MESTVGEKGGEGEEDERAFWKMCSVSYDVVVVGFWLRSMGCGLDGEEERVCGHVNLA